MYGDPERDGFPHHEPDDLERGILGRMINGLDSDDNPVEILLVDADRRDTTSALARDGWKCTCFAPSPYWNKLAMERPNPGAVPGDKVNDA